MDWKIWMVIGTRMRNAIRSNEAMQIQQALFAEDNGEILDEPVVHEGIFRTWRIAAFSALMEMGRPRRSECRIIVVGSEGVFEGSINHNPNAVRTLYQLMGDV
jgi:hypothetical protein